jgi:hypothetical protein
MKNGRLLKRCGRRERQQRQTHISVSRRGARFIVLLPAFSRQFFQTPAGELKLTAAR